jgi:hypothetical protein
METSQLGDLEMEVPVTVMLLRTGICWPLIGDVIFTRCILLLTCAEVDNLFVALPTLTVFGNNCAYTVVSIAAIIITERRSMIAPKEISGCERNLDTNVIITA